MLIRLLLGFVVLGMAAGRISLFKQSLNVPALRKLGLVLKQPSLLLPKESHKSVSGIDPASLKKLGLRCVVFDKDQTLTLTYVDSLHESATDAVARVKDEFGPGCVAILSNSVGSCDDVGYLCAAETEKNMNLAVIRHVHKKPACLDEVLAHFSTHAPDLLPEQICVVGDRVLTDVLFANLNGMHAILVAPISVRQDHPIAAIIRILERRVLLPLIRFLLRHH